MESAILDNELFYSIDLEYSIVHSTYTKYNIFIFIFISKIEKKLDE